MEDSDPSSPGMYMLKLFSLGPNPRTRVRGSEAGDSKATIGTTADPRGPRQGGEGWEVGRCSHSIHRYRDRSSLGGDASHSKEIRLGRRWERNRC